MKVVQTFEDGSVNAVVDMPDWMEPPAHPRQSVVADDHPVCAADFDRKWDHERSELEHGRKAKTPEPLEEPKPYKGKK